MRYIMLGALIAASAGGAASAASVTSLEAGSSWTRTDTRPGGAAEIVDLSGAGGALEANAPLPNGAVKLTTDATNAAKAEIGTTANFGVVSDIFGDDLSFSYSWYNDGTNSAPAAPSFKLAFFLPGYAGDGFGQLIYEPYAQGANENSYITPVTDDWVTASIDLNNGRFWNSGMFGIGSSFAGPPNKTLAEWLAAFAAADPNGFSQASLVAVSIGLGTFNPSEIGYVDDVRIAGTLADASYDFEVAAIPVPAALPLMLGGLAMLGFAARRRRA